MKNYNNQQSEAKDFHELRKQDMVKKAISDAEKKKSENEQLTEIEPVKKSSISETLNEVKTQLGQTQEELANEKQTINENINTLRKLQEEIEEKTKELELEKKKK